MLSTNYLKQLLSEAIKDASKTLHIEEDETKKQRFITNEVVQDGGHPLFPGCTDIYRYSEMIKIYENKKFNDQTIIKATIMEPYLLTERVDYKIHKWSETIKIVQTKPTWYWAQPNKNPINGIEISYIRTRNPILESLKTEKPKDQRIGKIVTIKPWDTLVKTYGLNKKTGCIKTPVPYHKSWDWLCEQPLVITKIREDGALITASGYLNGSPWICEEVIDKYLPDDANT